MTRSSKTLLQSSARLMALILSIVLVGSAAVAQDTESDELGQVDSVTPEQTQSPKRIIRIEVDSIIHPVAAQFVIESLEEADSLGAEAFVIQLSTPGGLLTSTREIFTAMLNAETPVIVYVSPSGAQAASAGFFVLMAADVAAMAPGTNTGAAHPRGWARRRYQGRHGR